MNSNKKYLTESLGYSQERGWIEMNFEDQTLENQFRIFNLPKEIIKSYIFCVFSSCGYIFQIVNSLFVNNFTISYTVISFLSCFFIEICLAIFTTISKNNF